MASELPSFGRSRDRRKKGMDLDSALGSLLDAVDKPDGPSQPRTSRVASARSRDSGSNFYSQMATEVDDFDLSENDDEVEVDAPDSKKLAESLNVDDMDANLFGGITKKKRSDSSIRSRTSSEAKLAINPPKAFSKPPAKDTTAKLVNEDAVPKPRQSILTQPPLEKTLDSKDSKPAVTDTTGGTKGNDGDDEFDDLLDMMLSDEQPKNKAKNVKNDAPTGKVSTSAKDKEQPVAAEFGKGVAKKPPVASRPAAKPASSPHINFDDGDDDDLLSGLGLDEGKSKKSTELPKQQAAPTAASRGSSSSLVTPKREGAGGFGSGKTASFSSSSSSPTPKAGEDDAEETVQFGFYVPSPSRPKTTAAGRKRRAESEFIVARPATAPDTSKKAVRFSDDLEQTSTFLAGLDKEEVPTKDIETLEEDEFPLQSTKEQMSSSSASLILGEGELLENQAPKSSRHQSMLNFSSSPKSFEPTQGRTRATSEGAGLEHPVFPWQKPKDGGSHTSAPPSRRPKEADKQISGNVGSRRDTMQSDVSSEFEVDSKEFKSAREKISELQSDLAKERNQLKDCQRQIDEGMEREKKLQEEIKEMKEKIARLEDTKRTEETELKEQLEENKIKLYKAELEHKQLEQLIETSKLRHQEEIEALQKCHNSRLGGMEESITRRESRWKEELESDGARWQEKLQELEREKMDAILSLKKKIESLEVSKTNEISRLQSVHRSTIEDLKRNHEEDKQRLIGLHHEEIEAIKAAHSHTRMLAELNSKVEASTREVSHLQAKLSDAHSRLLEEKAQKNRSHEKHLNVLEERLATQQAENDAERERLQSLVAKLEAHISQQSRSVEQIRWQQQQDGARLKAQQSAFREEKASSLAKLEEERTQFQQTKEKFLAEQQEILTKCYQEQQKVAAERAEVAQMKKKAEERETREKKMSMQLNQETAKVTADVVALSREQEEIKLERACLEQAKQDLGAYAERVRKRSEEVDELCKSSLEVRRTAERELTEAQKLKELLENQSSTLKAQFTELTERECRLAQETLALAEQRRSLQEEASLSNVGQDLDHLPPKLQQVLLSQKKPSMDEGISSSRSASFLGNLSKETGKLHSPHNQLSASLSSGGRPRGEGGSRDLGYSPCTSPTHMVGPQVAWVKQGTSSQEQEGQQQSSVGTFLAQIEHNMNLRQIAAAAEQDREYLDKGQEFIASLSTNTGSNYVRNFRR